VDHEEFHNCIIRKVGIQPELAQHLKPGFGLVYDGIGSNWELCALKLSGYVSEIYLESLVNFSVCCCCISVKMYNWGVDHEEFHNCGGSGDLCA
jgi:hypothetical protein